MRSLGAAPHRDSRLPRFSLPVDAVTWPPFVCCAFLVITLITPFTALGPHITAPGPLTTSICSMSPMGTSIASQMTPEKRGVNSDRPSIMTSILSEYILADPRMDTAQERPSTDRAVTPGTHCRASGIEVAPDLRISSAVSTKTDAG